MVNTIRILVVDDSDSVRESTSRVLEFLNYEVAGEARDGLEAIELTQKLRPHLVLMDIEMPHLNGIEAARRIQRIIPTPVILLTAHDSPALILKARDAGVAAYLVKPLHSQELERAILLALARFEDWMALRRLNQELRKRNAQLQQALATIKTLKGILPVCAWCHGKIQNGEGNWVSMESYIETHSEAEFTHGICPECFARLQDELDEEQEAK